MPHSDRVPGYWIEPASHEERGVDILMQADGPAYIAAYLFREYAPHPRRLPDDQSRAHRILIPA